LDAWMDRLMEAEDAMCGGRVIAEDLVDGG
jgi:hypothetical protein